MNVVLIIVAILLVLVGLVGSIVPGIAGPPFSFLGLLVLSFVKGVEYSTTFLVVMGLIAAVVFALDYVVPAWGTKKLGGTKAGVRGSTIGLILGLMVTFVFPIGFIAVLIGPFIGAYIGERGELIVTDVTAADYPPGLDIFPEGAYHLYDYMFFFTNLKENVAMRTAIWSAQRNPS